MSERTTYVCDACGATIADQYKAFRLVVERPGVWTGVKLHACDAGCARALLAPAAWTEHVPELAPPPPQAPPASKGVYR